MHGNSVSLTRMVSREYVSSSWLIGLVLCSLMLLVPAILALCVPTGSMASQHTAAVSSLSTKTDATAIARDASNKSIHAFAKYHVGAHFEVVAKHDAAAKHDAGAHHEVGAKHDAAAHHDVVAKHDGALHDVVVHGKTAVAQASKTENLTLRFLSRLSPKSLGYLITSVLGIIVCSTGICLSYLKACKAFETHANVTGRVLDLTPIKGCLLAQYVYEFDGKTFYGTAGVMGRFLKAGQSIMVLVDPTNPEKSTIRELFC